MFPRTLLLESRNGCGRSLVVLTQHLPPSLPMTQQGRLWKPCYLTRKVRGQVVTIWWQLKGQLLGRGVWVRSACAVSFPPSVGPRTYLGTLVRDTTLSKAKASMKTLKKTLSMQR